MLLNSFLNGETEKLIESDRVYLAPKPAFEKLLGSFGENIHCLSPSNRLWVRLQSDKRKATRLALSNTLPQDRRFASIHSNHPVF